MRVVKLCMLLAVDMMPDCCDLDRLVAPVRYNGTSSVGLVRAVF